MSPKGSQEERTQILDGLRVPLPADHISWEKEGKSILGLWFLTLGGGPPRIETLRGASRDSAGVLT